MQSPETHPSGDTPEFVVRNRGVVRQQDTLETTPAEAVPHGRIPNTPLAASTISFLLGCLFSLSLYTYLSGGLGYWWSTYQLGFYLAAWSAFHWGEFAVTAGWNREKCSIDSFLLDNGMLYHIAHSAALVEYLITLWIKPTFKAHAYVTPIGAYNYINHCSQALMCKYSTNFSHTVAFRKRESHELVTDGVYAWFRHPSYAGFFYWAIGTQLVLQNPVSFLMFTVILWRFFNNRIKHEEGALIRFFGQAYVQYRSKVSTRIPFIP
ncbi:hypothetical protein NM688_g4279 [Phlebia brevispora]|uniref:Uncharacterized protein n=1 Tax=Phlebia brevispora TaxID=194682 RepID=A0ACC1T3J8_9APHY|nr:hypothetical protein NM688_g4279 [Phlebia brevispora]